MFLLALALIALFGIGPVAVVLTLVGALGGWALLIPIVYLIICLFD